MRGIYKITNKSNDKCYIGRSDNIFTRCAQHFALLNANKHYSKKFQEDFNSSGIDNFVFEVVERCNIATIKEREAHYILKYNAIELGYNGLTKENFSQGFTNEEKENIIKKAFSRLVPNKRPSFLYLTEAIVDNMLPIMDNKMDSLRSDNEILVIPNKYAEHRNVPFIFTYKDLE